MHTVSSHAKRLRAGFTILEIMLAVMIFSMVLAAVYATWMSILRGSKAGLEAAASVQRSRIAMRTLEDAFLTSMMFEGNPRQFAFLADTSGDMADVSMISRLPASFPGVGRYEDQVVRRVRFRIEPKPGGNELIMIQAPMLQDIEQTEPYLLTLAKDVSLFALEFWDDKNGEWLDEWTATNNMPRMVKVTLGLGHQSGSSSADPRDMVSRLIPIPSVSVKGDLQGILPGIPNNPAANAGANMGNN